MDNSETQKKFSLDYGSMLKKAMENMPKKNIEKKRFEIPQIVSMQQGNKTIIRNFSDILSVLRRADKHLAKFFLKQLATPGNIEGDALVLQRKVGQVLLQKKLEDYIKIYVYCKVCGEPDTVLVKDGRIITMRCEACGARSAVAEI